MTRNRISDAPRVRARKNFGIEEPDLLRGEGVFNSALTVAEKSRQFQLCGQVGSGGEHGGTPAARTRRQNHRPGWRSAARFARSMLGSE